jgi:hypothetical protein
MKRNDLFIYRNDSATIYETLYFSFVISGKTVNEQQVIYGDYHIPRQM